MMGSERSVNICARSFAFPFTEDLTDFILRPFIATISLTRVDIVVRTHPEGSARWGRRHHQRFEIHADDEGSATSAPPDDINF